ncbi:Caffeoyl-CoA O-methyltransferase [Thiorhodococcus drewsii AZ1]|uniref:Caffeoyl-CoA O-methyltransferase n=1 Tax=Thiorhodococcus drewsii AZ1 TaxID=765913 RepID=G2E7W1_9GAMM|nr:class I SAM-dependent methyltransferase [Thiorhodococcus drewsii]EGV27801.1 Caffeoyl-CoA O-methyltransferase [Thiorhodococcus drewsii AZ1]
MTNRTIEMDDRLHAYLVAHSLRDSEVKRRLREETAPLARAGMQIAPEQGQLMGLLVELTGARRIVEVGTFTGYSALCMAEAMPAEGELICCDLSEEWTGIARRFWREAGVDDRIDLRLAPALETLDGLLAEGREEWFDMAFVDADKSNYGQYFERCLRLLRPGGLMLLDNTLWGGKVADPEQQDADTLAIRALNDRLVEDARVNLSLLPIGDGLTLARKR